MIGEDDDCRGRAGAEYVPRDPWGEGVHAFVGRILEPTANHLVDLRILIHDQDQ
jgi:hypothetical protein